MRLNRKWLYLGGLITILTLLLTLTWVLPAGAVGTLDDGELSADKSFVSPTLGDTAEDIKARTVAVTVTNSALTSSNTIDGDSKTAQVVLTVVTADADAITPTTTPLLIVDLNAAPGTSTSTNTEVSVNTLGSGHFPILGDLEIVGKFDTASGTDADTFKASDLGTPRIRNHAQGIIEIPVLGIIPSTNALTRKIELSYTTSDTETALVNIQGDSANFDLLAVENVNAQGTYSADFVVREPADVTLDPVSGVHHEQHEISSGLRGYVKYDDARITEFFTTYDAATGTLSGPIDFTKNKIKESPDSSEGEQNYFFARVPHPPIRENGSTAENITREDDIVETPVDHITAYITGNSDNNTETAAAATQGIIKFGYSDDASGDQTFAGFPGGYYELDYVGSDNFYAVVEHGPIALGTALENDIDDMTADTNSTLAVGDIWVTLPTPDGDTDLTGNSEDEGATVNQGTGDYLALVSIDGDGTNCDHCRLRFGVVTGSPATGSGATAVAAKTNEPLPARFSVLGVTYMGSKEKVTIPDGLHNDNGTGTNNDTHTFIRKLDAAPTSATAITIDPTVAGTPTITATNITVVEVNGRDVTFQLVASEIDGGADPVQKTSSHSFLINYPRQVGSLPQNALIPADSSPRPIIAISEQSRVSHHLQQRHPARGSRRQGA